MDYGIWNGEFSKPVTEHKKISLCTTCMNRSDDLMATLPANLELVKDYPADKVEFCIVDYSSTDGLEDRFFKRFDKDIANGTINFYKVIGQKHYSMTHSRNIAFTLASGDIVNNIDADNWLLNFLKYKEWPTVSICHAINNLAAMQNEHSVFIKTKTKMNGRLGMYRKDLIEVGGYNEQIQGYGADDGDLLNRCMQSGWTMYYYGGAYISRIRTSTEEKNANHEETWRTTEKRNKMQSIADIEEGRLIANVEQGYIAKCLVSKNKGIPFEWQVNI